MGASGEDKTGGIKKERVERGGEASLSTHLWRPELYYKTITSCGIEHWAVPRLGYLKSRTVQCNIYISDCNIKIVISPSLFMI